MALIKCSKCGNMVSDKASSCPKCGTPSSRMEYHVTEENPISKDCRPLANVCKIRENKNSKNPCNY